VNDRELRAAERRALQQVRARGHRAVTALREVEGAAWLWADSVRQQVEERLGIGPDDARALDDPAYCEVLDRCGELMRMRQQAEGAMARWQPTPSAARSQPAPEAAADVEAER
jgi:hypothetical protein